MSTPGTIWAVVDDLDVLQALFPDDRGACQYLTRYGDGDDGEPCLWMVSMHPDQVRDALGGEPLPQLPFYF